METFIIGFNKTAAVKGKVLKDVGGTAKKLLSGGAQAAKGYYKGIVGSGKTPLGDVLKLKGLYGVPAEAISQAGGIGKALKTERGRKLLSEAAGKVTPQAAAALGYGYLGKKLYDKTLGSPDQSYTSMGYY